MFCPHCQTDCTGNICPQCGIELAAHADNPLPQGVPEPARAPDPSKLNRSTLAQTGPDPPDWRIQIKHKLEEHNRKKSRRKKSAGEGSGGRKAAPNRQGRPLFEYRLTETEVAETRQKVVRFSKSGQRSQLAEKPLIRNPVTSSAAVRSQPPRQQALSLEAAMEPSLPPDAAKEEEPRPEVQISNEIILSRLLAGIIDLLFPLLISFLFLASGATVAQFELFSPRSFQLGLMLALLLFLFNSFFFLTLSGQTPGMYLTDLQLVGEDSETIAFRLVAIRVLTFLPVAATVAGLVWSFPDPLCRCAHDRLSGTRVIPVAQVNGSGRSTSSRN